MHVLLVVVAIHCLFFGFGFLLAGWGNLVGADPRELADLKQRSEAARQKGRAEEILLFVLWRQDFSSLSRLTTNWGDRPQARKFIYAGFACLAIAGTAGYFLGAFK